METQETKNQQPEKEVSTNLGPKVGNTFSAPSSAPPPPVQPKNKIKDLISEVFKKVKSNRKMFILLVALGGTILIITVFGVIYKLSTGGAKKVVIPSSSPVAKPEITYTEESKTSKTKLEDIKDQIQDLDVYQKRLTPPTIDFDVSF